MKKKITKILIGIIIFLLAIYFLLLSYINNELSMESRVGARIGGGELTIRENSIIAKCVDTYITKIKEGDLESAYKMLGGSYRRYVSFSDWQARIDVLDKDNLEINNPDIEIITKTTFDVPVSSSTDLLHYLVIVNETTNSFSIYPDLFLDYVEEKFEKSNNKVKYCVNNYTVYGDKLLFDATIKNNNKSSTTITNISVTKSDGTKLDKKEEITISPGEIKTITLEFENDYAFPDFIDIESTVKGKSSNTIIEFKSKYGGVK